MVDFWGEIAKMASLPQVVSLERRAYWNRSNDPWEGDSNVGSACREQYEVIVMYNEDLSAREQIEQGSSASLTAKYRESVPFQEKLNDVAGFLQELAENDGLREVIHALGTPLVLHSEGEATGLVISLDCDSGIQVTRRMFDTGYELTSRYELTQRRPPAGRRRIVLHGVPIPPSYYLERRFTLTEKDPRSGRSEGSLLSDEYYPPVFSGTMTPESIQTMILEHVRFLTEEI